MLNHLSIVVMQLSTILQWSVGVLWMGELPEKGIKKGILKCKCVHVTPKLEAEAALVTDSNENRNKEINRCYASF